MDWIRRIDEAAEEWANYDGSAIETKPQHFAANGAFVESINYAYSEGLDKPEIRNWKWPLAQ